ncbi:hypothetical protein F5148DRAFT_1165954 [Russula earlei]|uniref:Uncharacterized protein n=1 Tax=Russula earlei TaxID=71964 RepID=A0ACC0ULW3_9AGAM|nr:hypothetical protein F5148DRAFT_1165954 [Russula earlei]
MLAVPTLILPRDDELETLGRTVERTLGRSVESIDVIGRDPLSRTFAVAMQDGHHLIARVADSHMPTAIMESEIATMQWVRERTSIPVPKTLAYDLDQSHALGPHMLIEKVAGVRLDTIFEDLPAESQDSLVSQLARFMVDLSHVSFPAIGSIVLPQPHDPSAPSQPPSSPDLPPLGPLTHPCFYIEGRTALSIDRGPFPTARAYFLACAERERAATRALFTQGAPAGAEYQALLAETQAIVERAVTLLIELVRRCDGLDSADPELARYALDLHELGPKNVIVAPDDPTRILALIDWQSASVRPRWRCARTPYWLLPSLAGDDDACKQRLRSVFREAVANDPVFARAVDADDTRHALDEVAEYDAFRDGFLVLPTLQSILATLPGEEDVDGLRKLLDPQTLAGRAARMSLLTTGSGVLSLAPSAPESPMNDSPVTFGWNRKLYRYSVPATPRYSVPPTPIA